MSARPVTTRHGWATVAPIAAASAVVSATAVAASRRAIRQARHRRFDLELEAAPAEVRERLGVARARTRRHDMANAITAVEGAATILAREELRPTDRSTLTEVLESGLSRVRALLRSESAPDQAEIVLAEVAAAATKEPPWNEGIDIDVPADLVGSGSRGETAETVRQLLAYAHQRGPNAPLAIRGQLAGDYAVLWVEDRGPRITARQQEAILDPNRRAWHGAATVTTLHVAIRLTRQQGGDVRIEDRLGGGASFGVFLPVARG